MVLVRVQEDEEILHNDVATVVLIRKSVGPRFRIVDVDAF